MILEYLRARYLGVARGTRPTTRSRARRRRADPARTRPPWVDLEEDERDDWFVRRCDEEDRHEPSPPVPDRGSAPRAATARATGEKDEPQPFVVDLDIEVEVGDDSIEATADYRAITDAVREIVEDGSFDLIEAMADAIAAPDRAFPHVAG